MQTPTERRRTARLPAAAKLLHRAVGMNQYRMCEVQNVSTLSLELLLDRTLTPGTVVTILAPPEGPSRNHRRVLGSVERHEERDRRWMHVIKAPSKRPWSPMFLYNVIYQTMAVSKTRNPYGLVRMDDTEAAAQAREDRYLEMLARNAPPPDAGEGRNDSSKEGDPIVYRALSWFSPFHQLNDLVRQFIAREQSVTRISSGTTLIERGSRDDISIFLVEGVLEVEAFDGKKTHVAAGTRCAQFPISLLQPHAFTVKAVTDATVVLLSQEMVRKVSRLTATHTYNSRLGIQVSEVPSFLEEMATGQFPGDPAGLVSESTR